MTATQEAEKVPAPVRASEKRRFTLPRLTPGSPMHFAFCREGSGGVLALGLIAFWLSNFNPIGTLATYISMWFAFAVGVWYVWAQLRGVQFAGEESQNTDDKAVPRDARWSRYPMHAMHIMAGLSLIAWVLKTFTNVFTESAPMWLADALIMSWGYFFVLVLYYAIVMMDINVDSEIVATLRRFIGSRTRVNE